jgi:hypothetical protein
VSDLAFSSSRIDSRLKALMVGEAGRSAGELGDDCPRG